MSKLIKPLPDIPEKLLEASELRRLVPFIGAGASRLAGCPDWEGFAADVLKFIVEKTDFTYAQLAQIEPLNPRVKLSIAQSIANERGVNIDYRKILSPPEKGYKDARGGRLYGALSQLSKVFVTTNYDEWLDDERIIPKPVSKATAGASSSPPSVGKKRNNIYKAEEITLAALEKPGTVVHLHGSVLDPPNMVISTSDYIQKYANSKKEKGNYIPTFLEHLFDKKTVLFIGYGLQELEVLEYVIQKAKQSSQGYKKEASHFILQGFFSHETELMKALKRYYLEQCGIEIIPFLRDNENWDQLLNVLDHFAKEIPAQEPLILEKKIMMEAMLDD